jgi:uncharacterized protein (DUF885 family)
MSKGKIVLLVASIALVGTTLLAAQTWWGRPLLLRWFYDRNAIQEAIRSPMLLTQLQLLDGWGLAWYSDKLDDFSIAREDEAYAKLHREATLFATYDHRKLSGQALDSWRVARYEVDDRLAGERWRWHDYPVNSLFGIQSNLPGFLVSAHPIRSAADARDYIARLHGIPKVFDDVLAGLQHRERAGLLPLRFSVTKTIAQMEDFIRPAVAEHMLIVNLREKLDALPPGTLGTEQRQDILAEAQRAIEADVYPAYRRLIAHLQEVSRAPLTDDGVWRLPDGGQYYEYLVRHHTSTDLHPDAIHALGLAEVARLGAEVDALLDTLGIKGRTRAERIASLASRPDQRYPDDDAGRAAILRDYQAIIDDAERKSHETFPLRPDTPVVVKPVPKFAEKTAPGGYYEFPALDGSRPGIFFVNLHRIDSEPKFGMHTLVYHETIPGHHFQIGLQMKMADLPFFRRAASSTAYVEGWALYAERCAWELGFTRDPLDNLGRLQAELFRATRLVVDTGLHAKHWSREQAIDYMRNVTSQNEHDVTVEVERYLIDPGQALAYQVGMLKIVELRERAQRALGANFSLAEFHRLILQAGAVPLTVLDQIVEEWIASQSHASA